MVILVMSSHAEGNAQHTENSLLMATNLATSTTAFQMRLNIYFCKLIEVNYMLLQSSLMLLSVRFYTASNADTTVKLMLFASSNQRTDFTLATTKVLKAQDHANLVIQNCISDTNFAFSCFAKNELKRLNAAKDVSASLICSRKISKLTSKVTIKNVKKYSSLMCLFFVSLKARCQSGLTHFACICYHTSYSWSLGIFIDW